MAGLWDMQQFLKAKAETPTYDQFQGATGGLKIPAASPAGPIGRASVDPNAGSLVLGQNAPFKTVNDVVNYRGVFQPPANYGNPPNASRGLAQPAQQSSPGLPTLSMHDYMSPEQIAQYQADKNAWARQENPVAPQVSAPPPAAAGGGLAAPSWQPGRGTTPSGGGYIRDDRGNMVSMAPDGTISRQGKFGNGGGGLTVVDSKAPGYDERADFARRDAELKGQLAQRDTRDSLNNGGPRTAAQIYQGLSQGNTTWDMPDSMRQRLAFSQAKQEQEAYKVNQDNATLRQGQGLRYTADMGQVANQAQHNALVEKEMGLKAPIYAAQAKDYQSQADLRALQATPGYESPQEKTARIKAGQDEKKAAEKEQMKLIHDHLLYANANPADPQNIRDAKAYFNKEQSHTANMVNLFNAMNPEVAATLKPAYVEYMKKMTPEQQQAALKDANSPYRVMYDTLLSVGKKHGVNPFELPALPQYKNLITKGAAVPVEQM